MPQPRIMLAEELKYWGNGTLQNQLDLAFRDFVSYCRLHKLPHSQPPFKVKMVLWLDY